MQHEASHEAANTGEGDRPYIKKESEVFRTFSEEQQPSLDIVKVINIYHFAVETDLNREKFDTFNVDNEIMII